MNSRKPIRKFRKVTPVKGRYGSLPPLFLTVKLRKAIERLLPSGHHQRMRQYFDIYGCLHCSRTNVLYGANGFCRLCISLIGKRLRKIDKQLETRKPEVPPKWEETYLRPYNSARQLLADLLRKNNNGQNRQKPGSKFPPKVYLKY